MKKVIHILAIFFALSIVSGVLYAKTETEYEKAIRYYNSGNYKEAVEIFKEYIKVKPVAPAYYRIGYSLYELGQYDEANKYFKQAYLIDPSFSPEIVAPIKKTKKPMKKPSVASTPSTQAPKVPAVTETKPETPSAPVRGPQPQMQMEPHKQQAQGTAPVQGTPPGKTPAIPGGEEATPQKLQVPPRGMQAPQAPPMSFPKPTEGLPSNLGPGLMAGLGMIMTVIQIVSILLYLFFCYCLFRIAKKLDISAPWLAFIPIINIWTIVSCAGKPWWWILLLLIPFINVIIVILLWVYITENMGKNKWLGLLMIVPIVNYIFLAILAFSKSEGMGTAEEMPTV